MRAERVGAQIQSEISNILRTRIQDPRIGFVSITSVEVTADLSIAKVFVSVYGSPEAHKESMAGLEAATPFIRREMGHRLELRYTPEIRFVEDVSLERGARVLEKIKEIVPPKEKSTPKRKKKTKTKKSARSKKKN